MSHYTSSARQEATPADLDFGHGFIPRIGEENYEAVDRCVGPADLFSTSLDLPWAIVDGAWAEKKPELLTARDAAARHEAPGRHAQIVATAGRFNDVPAKPLVLSTPLHPIKDGPSKLESLTALSRCCEG
jgi:hypothetical protein